MGIGKSSHAIDDSIQNGFPKNEKFAGLENVAFLSHFYFFLITKILLGFPAVQKFLTYCLNSLHQKLIFVFFDESWKKNLILAKLFSISYFSL